MSSPRALPFSFLSVSLLPWIVLLATPVAGRAQDQAPPLNPLALFDKATLKGFVEKPLFEPSRHPPVPPAPVVAYAPPAPPPPPPVVEQPPMLRLLGVVEGAHSLAAIVRREDTGKTQTLRPGDRMGGWVVEVMPTGLRVQNGERIFDYGMFKGLQSGPQPVAQNSASPATALTAARNLLTGGSR